MHSVDKLIMELPLKEMDPSLLQRAIVLHAHAWNRTDPEYDDQISIPQLESALTLASYLHRKQTRANRANLPRTHYIEHPLRNVLRIMRYGCTNQDLIIAAALHDTVEDCLSDILIVSGSFSTPSTWTGRAHAFAWLEEEFGYEVSRLVDNVTNPEWAGKLSKSEKRARYVDHVVAVIEDAPTALLKLTDFIDNAAGLYHNDLSNGSNRSMVSHLAKKYFPLVSVFLERIRREDFRALVSEEGQEQIFHQLTDASVTLAQMAAMD